LKELDSSETMVSSNVNWWTAMEHKDKTRRVHDAEFKAKVLGECRQPGASIAAVALRHGLNAKYVFSPPVLTARMPARPVDSDVA
jgi:hypothetical protein